MADIIQFPDGAAGDLRRSERLRILMSGKARIGGNPGGNLTEQAAALGSPDEWAQSACFHLSCGLATDTCETTVSTAALWMVLGYVERLEIETGRIPAPRCETCAFRLGTIANQSPVTTSDADWCGHPGEADFMCHEGVAEGEEPTKACAGWAELRKERAA